jgi:hypothetical protein
MAMGLFELALIFSVVVALYNLQQIKMILKDKGYNVSLYSGWLSDYHRFKIMAQQETDQEVQIKYRKVLNGLLFSLVGTVLFAILILKNRL